MLPDLAPEVRALVYGLLGGVPLYLSWWDQTASVVDNLARLATSPGARLLTEGQLILATEGDHGDLPAAVLHGDGARHTASRTTSSRCTSGCSRFRAEIERGLGTSILPVLMAGLDDFMGPRWEEMFRSHLRRLAAAGRLGPEIVAVGPWWSGDGQNEIDAVALAGRSRVPVLVGEAEWAREVDGARLSARLRVRAAGLPGANPDDIQPAVCSRGRITGAPPGTLAVTATDVMS